MPSNRNSLKPKKPWSALYPNASADALDLLDRLLQFNPDKRITADEALAHPYLQQFHNTADEPTLSAPIAISIDDNKRFKINEYRKYLYRKIIERKKQLRAKRQKAKDGAGGGGGDGDDSPDSSSPSTPKGDKAEGGSAAPVAVSAAVAPAALLLMLLLVACCDLLAGCLRLTARGTRRPLWTRAWPTRTRRTRRTWATATWARWCPLTSGRRAAAGRRSSSTSG